VLRCGNIVGWRVHENRLLISLKVIGTSQNNILKHKMIGTEIQGKESLQEGTNDNKKKCGN